MPRRALSMPLVATFAALSFMTIRLPKTTAFSSWSTVSPHRLISSYGWHLTHTFHSSTSQYATGEDHGEATEGSDPKRVVFLGTPPVAARSLELLLDASKSGRGGGFEVSAVVTQPPARSGRKKRLTPSPVHQLAEAQGIPVLTPEKAKDEDFLQALREDINPDLCITAAYGQFLPTKFLNIPKFGTLNIHPSLLPLYRGASPVQRSLQDGVAETGVSVLFTVLKMDAGPIVRQPRITLDGDEQTPDLLLRLFELGTKELVDALPSVWSGECIPIPQDETLATKADKIDKSEGLLDFREGAEVCHNKVRGFAGWPGTWAPFSIGGKDPVNLKIKASKIISRATNQPSSLSNNASLNKDGVIEVQCDDGSIFGICEIQAPNKNSQPSKVFWNGLRGEEMSWATEELAKSK
eukprot:CAMPEP_0113935962 /NCGR_PEP_ID=MMETSP1339-20121228/2974_1 /TAXON_ID=94617 /ORGANISM="Fibrocapsa japonica" /LENGTH=408 /DNA_ID=CAMNT_0000938269 /DNA_START=56 /DNA_END=1282 /DNA_ORIENTATION=- /assembly_acc=CAM_ASM_000762